MLGRFADVRNLGDGGSSDVMAPTVVTPYAGLAAVFLALSQQSRCFYTTPIEALSNQKFAGVEVVRGLLPEDTIFTYYSERDGAGDALRMTQPPGRLFVLDSGLFTLFDVLTRSAANMDPVSPSQLQMLGLVFDAEVEVTLTEKK